MVIADYSPPLQAYEERQKMAKDQYLLEKAAYEARNQVVVPGAASPAAVSTGYYSSQRTVLHSTIQLSPDGGVEPAAVSPVVPAQTSAASSDEEESSPDSSAASDSDESDEDAPPVKKKHHAPATVKTEKVKKHKKNKA